MGSTLPACGRLTFLVAATMQGDQSLFVQGETEMTSVHRHQSLSEVSVGKTFPVGRVEFASPSNYQRK